jgi:hypothetical protein
MDNKNTTFTSGNEYSLSEIFTENNKIVIPDLQRDYCWGDKAWDGKDDKEKNYTELVSGFLDNLISSFDEPDKEVTMGLIYGYEQPKHYIQLCDGQQRITTLFLLLGMLNRKTENKFQKHLISNYELNNDDKEPYLQYAIRESTLYFLSDLVCEFFLKKDVAVDKIKEQDWYFAEYDLDASIQSMLAAIKTIECKLSNVNDCKSFGEFILTKLKMIYYDMGNRTRGEETFVVINTTGEPLTATENLKPILLGDLKGEDLETYSKQWEDREEWFWKNRGEKQTADDGLDGFFIWYWQIRLLQEKTGKERKSLNPKELFVKKPEVKPDEEEQPQIEKWEESVKLGTVHNYFLGLKKLIDLCKDDAIAKVLKSIEDGELNLSWFRNLNADIQPQIILPLISYLSRFPDAKFPDAKLFCEFVRRIRRNYFDKKRERGNFVDWRHIVQIIEFSEKEDGVLKYQTLKNKDKFKNIPNVNLNEWYDTEEQNKDILRKDHKPEVEKWEDHIDLMGDLTPFWKANEGRENTFENISAIYNTFELLYNCYDENEAKANSVLSNYFRLYRVLIESPRLGSPSYTRGLHGAWFSRRNQKDNSYFSYLNNPDVLSLLKLEKTEITDSIKKIIKQKLSREEVIFGDTQFSAEKHLKAWLLIKVLYAEKTKTLLAFWDGRGTENGEGNGLASYKDCVSNKINLNLSFSLGNSICGYAVKRFSYIEYNDGNLWENESIFDKPITGIITYSEFDKRKSIPILQDKIEKIDKKIQELLDDFYK